MVCCRIRNLVPEDRERYSNNPTRRNSIGRSRTGMTSGTICLAQENDLLRLSVSRWTMVERRVICL